MDNKYGRLFTESDVHKIIRHAVAGQTSDPAMVFERMKEHSETFTFPEDEPLFLLRAQDSESGAGLYGYREAMEYHSDEIPEPHREGVHDAINRWEQWQKDNNDRVKLPG